MAPVAGSRLIKGEARVTYLKPKYAVLSKPGLDGSIFVVPSHIMGQQFGYPDMHDLLSLNDIVEFEAVPQEEQNGIKWQALDGTVKVKQRAAEVEYRDTGTVTFLDERMGQYGFLESNKGSVWFNANVVRPETKDVAKVLKKGQQVHFVAVKQVNKQTHSSCQYRATVVHGKNWKKPTTSSSSLVTKPQTGKVTPIKPGVGGEVNGGGMTAWSCSSGSRESSRPSTPNGMATICGFPATLTDRLGSFADVASASSNSQSPAIAPPRHPRTQPLDIILSGDSQLLPCNNILVGWQTMGLEHCQQNPSPAPIARPPSFPYPPPMDGLMSSPVPRVATSPDSDLRHYSYVPKVYSSPAMVSSAEVSPFLPHHSHVFEESGTFEAETGVWTGGVGQPCLPHSNLPPLDGSGASSLVGELHLPLPLPLPTSLSPNFVPTTSPSSGGANNVITSSVKRQLSTSVSPSQPPQHQERESYDRQLIFLQRIAHKLLGITSASQCPVCEPSHSCGGGSDNVSLPK